MIIDMKVYNVLLTNIKDGMLNGLKEIGTSKSISDTITDTLIKDVVRRIYELNELYTGRKGNVEAKFPKEGNNA